ncbi:type I polyketide synthase [Micromonospora sp. WMMD882]|uniref:type I polyketide synthase n=1 Tax=Micromonospora sp. WMMD882 TaxID=3015151 RepID=UPI00248B534D|nr:type I polyketide synthase [Micromonospora sp. WMMD882]WBB80649.1 type I polyketide synthase [Micromonospora sp. WMMD882]
MTEDPKRGEQSALLRAFLAIEELEAELDEVRRARHEPIAIIGAGCRFPGGGDGPAAFWRLLRDGVDAAGDVPADRWDLADFYDPDPDRPGRMYTRQGHFVDGVDQFDPAFFGIAPREAASLDPQQRMLLEVAWEALEHAGQVPDRLVGSPTGVFVGIMTNDYLQLQTGAGDPTQLDLYAGTGNDLSFPAGRLSYLLGLQGPSMAVTTACSSSLVALHLAVRSLRAGECDQALVGGVNAMLAPDAFVTLSKMKALAVDGRCKTFDASADGYGRGEGCGVVVVKRLSDAQRDGDRVLAVVRGTAVNHDGPSGGLTVPNGLAQQALLRAALADAGVEPADVDYVEAHGTGTSLGDPIEVRALASVLGRGRPVDRPVLVGSVKTNIGHLEAAAGVAGLIKLVLALRHEQVPPHLHFRTPNPHIDWDGLPIQVPVAPRPWPRGERPRIAGLSSFGMSGTNAHVVVGEAPEAVEVGVSERSVHVLPLSARDEVALRVLAQRYVDLLDRPGGPAWGVVCAGAAVTRSRFGCRLAVVASDVVEGVSRLRGWLAGEADPRFVVSGVVVPGSGVRVGWLFTGQGAQYVGMARGLYESVSVFRVELDRCAAVLDVELGRSLLEVLFSSGDDASVLDGTGFTQPVLFAVEWALAAVWRSWGVVPDVVGGHSVGELVAACVAGVLSVEDGLRLVVARAGLMQGLPSGGGMVAVALSEDAVLPLLVGSGVVVAAVNSPVETVVAGSVEALDVLRGRLAVDGVKSSVLRVSHAFHSPLMEPMVSAFRDVAGSVEFRRPERTVVSGVTGAVADGSMGSADYWVGHVLAPVRFADGVRALVGEGCSVVQEIGPHPVLLASARLCVDDDGGVLWLPSLRRGRDDWRQMMTAVANLFVRGVELDWVAVTAGVPSRVVDLPTYPFQRQRYWSAPKPGSQSRRRAGGHPLLGQRLRAPALRDTVFEAALSATAYPLLAEHRLHDQLVVPGAHHVAMLLAAATENGVQAPGLRDVLFVRPLVLPESGDRPAQTVLSATDATMRLVTFDDPDWTEYVAARLDPDAVPDEAAPDLDAITGACDRPLGDLDAFYRRVTDAGLSLGPSFRWLDEVRVGDGVAVGEIRTPDALDTGVPYPVHPGLLDACFQLLGLSRPQPDGGLAVHVPFRVDRLRVTPSDGTGLRAYARSSATGTEVVGDVVVADRAGRVVVELRGLRLRHVDPAALRRPPARGDDLRYELTWPVADLTASAGVAPGRWLVFADAGGVGREVAALLAAAGHTCALVRPGAAFTVDGPNAYRIDPGRAGDVARLLDAVGDADWRGVLHLWALDGPADPDVDLTDLQQAQRTVLESTLHLVRTLATRSMSPRTYLVTRGGQAVGEPAGPLALAQAPLWGLGGTVALEHPELRCVRVDLDPGDDSPAGDAAFLVAEVSADDREDQVARRDGQRHVARLARCAVDGNAPLAVPAVESYRLEVATPGVLDRLALRPVARRTPAVGQVELRVRATGLNFRDVLNALDMYPGEAGPLGLECVGEVVALGADVAGLAVGDRVVALAPASFGSFVTVDANLVAPLPAVVGDADGATIPVTFLTARYALDRIARLGPGDRVLIHAAAGGVGLAAVQLAQAVGAEVYATASPAKWPTLRRLGVRRLSNSRTLAFAEEIRQWTGGAGVDVVLNSLTGDFIVESLRLLRPGGRFVEIGKREIWSAEQVARLRDDVSYTAFDLVELSRDEPATVRALLAELMRRFADGELQPLPSRVFGLPRAVDAFRHMAQARHVGKIVVSHDPVAAEPDELVRPDGTYLVTGGLGGLGRHVARWLVERGARTLVLVGRSAGSDDSRADVAALRAAGARVEVVRADITRADEVSRLVGEVTASLPPLRGVFHAAGVLDDGILLQQEWSRFARVLGPKVAGAWHLHRATHRLDLDFFVLFSSVAALLGSAGQGNYAAGNAFLDLLAAERRRQGLPGLSVDWGPWRGAGMAAGLDDDRQWAARGMGLIDPERGVAELAALLGQPRAQVGVVAVEWGAYLRQYPSGRRPPLLDDLAAATGVDAAGPAAGGSDHRALVTLLADAAPDDRADLIVAHVRELAARVLGVAAAHTLETRRPLNELGLDSLMAVELRNALSLSVDRSLPATVLFDYPTVEALAGFVAGELAPAEPAAPAGPPPTRAATPAAEPDRDAWLAEIAQLSDAEVEALLEQELSPSPKDRHE